MGKSAAKYVTAKNLASHKAKAKPYEVPDKEVSGLTLRVMPTGVKTWAVMYRINGQRKRLSLGSAGIKTLAQARIRAKDILQDAEKGIDASAVEKEKRASTLGSYLDSHYAAHAAAHMKSHVVALQSIRRNFKDLLKKPMGDISELDIARYRQRRQKDGVTFETLKRDFTTLKACLNAAMKVHKVIPSHALERFTLKRRADGAEPSNVKSIRYLLPEEEQRLRAALDAREARMRQERASANVWRTTRGRDALPTLGDPYVDYLKPLVLLAINTGLRRGDLFSLKWEHVDLPQRQIRKVINKTSRHNATDPAVLPLSAEAVSLLREWKGQGVGTGYVFPSEVTGARLNNIDKAWAKLIEDAAVANFRFHDLRHTFASRLVMAGVDINTVRELMTHADIKMTLVYAHLSPDHKAAALDRAFGGAK